MAKVGFRGVYAKHVRETIRVSLDERLSVGEQQIARPRAVGPGEQRRFEPKHGHQVIGRERGLARGAIQPAVFKETPDTASQHVSVRFEQFHGARPCERGKGARTLSLSIVAQRFGDGQDGDRVKIAGGVGSLGTAHPAALVKQTGQSEQSALGLDVVLQEGKSQASAATEPRLIEHPGESIQALGQIMGRLIASGVGDLLSQLQIRQPNRKRV